MEIRWELLDENSFVGLVADLLKRLGFIDLLVQGDGPDGGLDLIATELVSFAFQGARPVKWGIQCKFSRPGGRRAVNDSEVRDVEGILRSKRYASHDLQGYMVVTNRRISQNVVERLSGIDETSQFRASWLDGAKLDLYLGKMPELLNSYFGRLIQQIEELAEEQAQERYREQNARGEFIFNMPGDPYAESYLPETGELTGFFESSTGVLSLEHDVATGSVVGRYTYHSDDYVAEVDGEMDRFFMTYRFRWFDRDIHGMGFYLISEDLSSLQGVWLSTEELLELPLEIVLKHGTRNWYRRVE